MVQKAGTILMRRNKLSHLLFILSRTNPTRKGPRIANPGLHSCCTEEWELQKLFPFQEKRTRTLCTSCHRDHPSGTFLPHCHHKAVDPKVGTTVIRGHVRSNCNKCNNWQMQPSISNTKIYKQYPRWAEPLGLKTAATGGDICGCKTNLHPLQTLLWFYAQ